MSNPIPQEEEFSLKSLFVPLTTLKAIHIIIIAGFIVYFNVLFNGFVWDDNTFVLGFNQSHPFNFGALFRPNLFNEGGQYRPLAALYFSLVYSLFNNMAFFYHLFQIILHIFNAALLFIFFKKFLHKNIAFFLSLIFLVHPINVESASFISSVSPLFFAFGMSALVLSLKANLTKKNYIFISLLLLLSLLTKETGFVFVFLILLYYFIFNKKYFQSFLFYSGITILAYFIIRFGIGQTYFAQLNLIPIARLSFAERLLNIPAIIFYYLKTFFFPSNLSIEQQWVITSVGFIQFYFPLIIALIFFVSIFYLGQYINKKNKKLFPIFIFFLCWFLVAMLIHIQLFPLNMTVADRWFYLPMVGLLGILGLAVQQITVSKNIKKLAIIVAVIIILLLALRTMIRNTNWHDSITLFSHDIQIHDNFNIENNLGGEYVATKQYSKALKHYKRSVDFFPYETNLYNVGSVYELLGEKRKAKEYYSHALQAKNYLTPGHKHSLQLSIRYGWLTAVSDEPGFAKKVILSALEDYPDSVDLWEQLAVVEYKLHNQQAALSAVEKARLLSPDQQREYLYTQIQNKQPITISTDGRTTIRVEP